MSCPAPPTGHRVTGGRTATLQNVESLAANRFMIPGDHVPARCAITYDAMFNNADCVVSRSAVGQVFAASMYPFEIAEAQQWVQDTPTRSNTFSRIIAASLGSLRVRAWRAGSPAPWRNL